MSRINVSFTRFQHSPLPSHGRKSVLVALLVLVASVPALAAPLAVLSDVGGQVQVVRGKKTVDGKTGTSLDAGDVVRVVKGNATVFYATRAPQILSAGHQITVGAGSEGTPQQASTWKGLYTGLSSGFARRSQTKAFAVRGSKIDTAACPLVPAGLIADSHPTLVWVAPNKAVELGIQDYEIYLFGPKGKLIWRTITNRTFVVYPDDAPPLEPNTEYVWQVTPRRLMKSKRDAPQLRLDEDSKSVGLWFRVAKASVGTEAQAEMTRLQAELSDLPLATQHLALASALRQRKLATAALTTLMPAIFAPPDAPETTPHTLRWPLFRAAHAELDEASQVLINELAAETDVDSG